MNSCEAIDNILWQAYITCDYVYAIIISQKI